MWSTHLCHGTARSNRSWFQAESLPGGSSSFGGSGQRLGTYQSMVMVERATEIFLSEAIGSTHAEQGVAGQKKEMRSDALRFSQVSSIFPVTPSRRAVRVLSLYAKVNS